MLFTGELLATWQVEQMVYSQLGALLGRCNESTNFTYKFRKIYPTECRASNPGPSEEETGP